MNKELEEFAREKIKEGLHSCTEGQIDLFKRMYQSDEELSLDEVVNKMHSDKLDWAMQQIQRTSV